MNQPLNPNATAAAPADPDRTGAYVESADTHAPTLPAPGSRPGDGPPAPALPAVPGYRVLREIARGGMGKVFAAFDLTLDREVALKVLLPGADATRFVRESKITARLPHPSIPPVHALGTLADGSPFLAMKLVVGRTLAMEMKVAEPAAALNMLGDLKAIHARVPTTLGADKGMDEAQVFRTLNARQIEL